MSPVLAVLMKFTKQMLQVVMRKLIAEIKKLHLYGVNPVSDRSSIENTLDWGSSQEICLAPSVGERVIV